MSAYKGFCTDCGARHEVGAGEIDPGCQCGGDIKAVANMTREEAIRYEHHWRKEAGVR